MQLGNNFKTGILDASKMYVNMILKNYSD